MLPRLVAHQSPLWEGRTGSLFKNVPKFKNIGGRVVIVKLLQQNM